MSHAVHQLVAADDGSTPGPDADANLEHEGTGTLMTVAAEQPTHRTAPSTSSRVDLIRNAALLGLLWAGYVVIRSITGGQLVAAARQAHAATSGLLAWFYRTQRTEIVHIPHQLVGAIGMAMLIALAVVWIKNSSATRR